MCKFFKKHYFNLFLSFLLGFFIFSVVYFVFFIKLGLPPDELEHLGQIRNYFRSSEFFMEPEDFPSSNYGALNQSRFLYHMILGKLLHLNFFPIQDYIFLRIINVIFSLGYLFFFYKLLRLFFKNQQWFIITAFAIQTNILMFTFLSASINYDNLVNLLSVMSIYFIFKHIQTNSIQDLLFAGISIGFGMLTKISFGPLVAGLFLMLIFHHRKRFIVVCKDFCQYIKTKKNKNFFILGIFLVILVVNAALYIGNYMKYGAIFPKCHIIYSLEQCIQDYPDYSLYNVKPQEEVIPMGRYEYFQQWGELMKERTFGIFAHQTLVPTGKNMLFVDYLFLIFAIFFIRKIDIKNAPIMMAIGLILLYGGFLVFGVNYKSYSFNGIIHAGVQGRYLFPVLPLMVIVFTHFMLSMLKGKLRIVASLILVCLFIYLAFPSFYYSADKDAFERHDPILKSS